MPITNGEAQRRFRERRSAPSTRALKEAALSAIRAKLTARTRQWNEANDQCNMLKLGRQPGENTAAYKERCAQMSPEDQALMDERGRLWAETALLRAASNTPDSLLNPNAAAWAAVQDLEPVKAWAEQHWADQARR